MDEFGDFNYGETRRSATRDARAYHGGVVDGNKADITRRAVGSSDSGQKLLA